MYLWRVIDMQFIRTFIEGCKEIIHGRCYHYVLELGFHSASEREKSLEAMKKNNVKISWYDMRNPKARRIKK